MHNITLALSPFRLTLLLIKFLDHLMLAIALVRPIHLTMSTNILSM